MASHRKLMSAYDDTSTEDYCNGTCIASCLSFKQTCLTYCYDNCDNSSSLYPPLPPPNSSHSPLKTSKLLIIIFTVVATTFIALCCYVIYRKYKSRRIAESQTVVEQRIRDDFIDEDHGPIIDHPIWYIRTVGLNQAVIDSISVIKYKKGEGLIEGTDCSVCLSEFQEDDTLRLLPKCSHAFHIPCIDTWLGSHTNCPLCRAPIVSNTVVASLPERNIEESQSVEVRVDVLEETEEESEGGIGRIEEEGEGSESARFQVNRDIGYQKEGETLSNLASESTRFQINYDCEDTGQGIQPIRRSVSLDSLAASKITQEIGDLEKESKVVIVPSRVGGSRRFLKLMMGSSSIGRSLQSGPVLMKRSSSCQGKLGRNAELPVRSF